MNRSETLQIELEKKIFVLLYLYSICIRFTDDDELFCRTKGIISIKEIKKTLKTSWPLFMDRVQLPEGYRSTSRRQFTFYH